MRAETLSAFERHLTAAGSRPATTTTYLRITRRYLAFLGDQALESTSREDVERFLTRPRKTGAPAAVATRNLDLTVVRRLFQSRGSHDPTEGLRLKRPVRRDPAVPTTGELRLIFEATKKEKAPELALAQVILLFQAGLRVHELVSLNVEQVDLDGALLVAVEGKGGTLTDIPLAPESVSVLEQWLSLHPCRTGPLFPSRSPGADRASVRSVQRLLERLSERAGLARHITPHGLRHATATEAIRRGVSLPVTAALMRHARVETTMIYIKLASTERRDAAAKIGAAIPSSVVPQPRNHSGIEPSKSALGAVDAEDDFCDAA